MNLKEVTAAIFDNGQFCALAERLARDYGKVLYVISQDEELPKFNDAMVGVGLPGVEVIDSRDDERCDEADIFIFPDLGFGKTQTKLEAEGRLVWGARNGEQLEQSREDCKAILEQVGLPVGPWVSIVGFSALRDYLQKNGDVYVKVSKYRGSWETIYCKTYEDCKPELDLREVGLSGISEIIPFVVEKKMADKLELACDAYVIDGQWPSKLLVGMEEKSQAYLGRFMDYSEVPAPLQQVNAALAPILKGYGYRGFMSIETLIGKDGIPFVNDPCCRMGSPPGELYQEFYANLPEIILQGAAGVMVDPVPVDGAVWGAEVMIQSEWVDKNWQPVRFPEKYRLNVKLNESCRIDGKDWVIPQNIGFNQCGGIIGWGKTMKEAIALVTKIAETVEGIGIRIPVEAFEPLKEKLAEAASFGMKI